MRSFHRFQSLVMSALVPRNWYLHKECVIESWMRPAAEGRYFAQYVVEGSEKNGYACYWLPIERAIGVSGKFLGYDLVVSDDDKRPLTIQLQANHMQKNTKYENCHKGYGEVRLIMMANYPNLPTS